MGRKNDYFGMKIGKADRITLVIAPVLFVCLFILVGIFGQSYSNSQTGLVRDSMAEISQNQAMQFQEFIEDKENTLKGLTSYPQIYRMDRSTQYAFLTDHANDWGFSHFFILDTEGIGYYPNENGTLRDQSGEPFFSWVSAVDEYVTTPYYAEYSAIITICEAIYDPSGKRVGTLCGAVNLEDIQEKMNTYESILGGSFFTVDRNGTFVSSYDDYSRVYNSTSVYNLSDSDIELIREAFDTGADASGNITLTGTEYYAYAAYLANCDWVIVQCIPRQNVIGQLEGMYALQILLAFAGILLFAVILRVLYLWRASDNKINRDPLTGCGSRAACLTMMERLNEDRRNQIAVLYTDLNRFKYANDTFGHDTGDTLLKIFSEVLTEVFGQEGFVGRMGGDEFVVFLTGKSYDQVEELWTMVEAGLELRNAELSMDNYRISAAHGIALSSYEKYRTMDELLQEADNAMYRNKQKSRKESDPE